jgi:hypothetical protein
LVRHFHLYGLRTYPPIKFKASDKSVLRALQKEQASLMVSADSSLLVVYIEVKGQLILKL